MPSEWPSSSTVAVETTNRANAGHENVAAPPTTAAMAISENHSERTGSQTTRPSLTLRIEASTSAWDRTRWDCRLLGSAFMTFPWWSPRCAVRLARIVARAGAEQSGYIFSN